MIGPKIRRLYYSAKEVTDETGVSTSTLKAWEIKYPMVKPIRHRSGRRLYRPEDLERIRQIKSLEEAGHDETYILNMLHKGHGRMPQTVRADLRLLLLEIETELTTIREMLHQYPLPL